MGPLNTYPDLNLVPYTPIASSSTSPAPAGASTSITAFLSPKTEPKSEPVDDWVPNLVPVSASNHALVDSPLPLTVYEFARFLRGKDPADGGDASELTPSAIVPAPSAAAVASVPPKRGKRQLLRRNRMTADDLSYNREIVRKTRMLYDSLKRYAMYETEKNLGIGNGRRLRADLRAASFMKDRGFWLNPDKKIVGSVPGVCIGDVFLFRMEMCVVGLHCQPQAGIDYLTSSDSEDGHPVATSVIVSGGGYEDDEDHGEVITYSGHGGRDKFNRPCSDQKLEGGNLAMTKAMELGLEIRVIRGFSNDGIKVYVYDGLYKITNSWCAIGKSGFSVYKFRLIRIEGQEEMGSRKFELANSIRTIPMQVRPNGYLTFDMSSGKERVPVFVFNDVDSDTGPLHVEYLPRAVFPAFLYQGGGGIGGGGCDCVGGCNSNCLCAIKNGGEFAYDSVGFLLRGKPLIHECGVHCKCPPSCKNRVSQRGLRRRLEVFRSRESGSGWGVRTLELIQAGSFICEYSGVVLTRDQARVFSMAGDELVYPGRFAPNWTEYGDLSSIIPGIAPTPPESELPALEFAIDVSSLRNAAAYMCHSMSPNVMAQYVVYDHNSLSFPHIMLFAMEAIAPMKELTVAYQDTVKLQQELCSLGM